MEGIDEERVNLNLNEIWKACRKIQDAIFRYGFDICAEFCPHDPKGKGLISESLFSAILGKYKRIIGLSDFELREVTDYFRLRDGRVVYKQFCKVVCSENHDKSQKKDLATGLEWNDPMHVNVIPRPEDRRQLCLVLIKIALVSHLPLKPYFQDYELVSNNVGTVTVSHFSRVLHFLKIPVSDNDFLLLLKRYLKDSYMVNYVAFITHIESIIEYLKQRNLTDNAQQIVKDFPGCIVDLELPELPPVEGTNMAQRIFKDYCDHPKENRTDCDVVVCIQHQVHKNRIRIREFLEGFDLLHTGTVTINQFERALHNMGLGKFISHRDFQLLCYRYRDPIDTNRIMWRIFEDEVDRVFTVKRLEKTPLMQVESPPKNIKEMPRVGSLDWQEVGEKTRDLCEEALRKIQIRIRNRRLHLHPFFKNYDKLNSGHLRCRQANQIFTTNGILLSNDELNALIDRYGNELGFNYTRFLEDADPAEYAIPKLMPPASMQTACLSFKNNAADTENEEYVIQLLTKAKRQATVKNIPVIDFLQDFDRHREGEILEVDFRRGVDTADIKMTPNEMDTICKIFRSPKRACCVLYRDFCKALDEIFVQIETVTGDSEIIAVPLVHLANLDCVECFMNFEERTICSQALMKLARKPDEISNLSSVFKDFDRENCGTIRKNQLIRGLTVRDMHYMISSREFEAVFKCFGVQRGLDLEFNYREFLNILSIIYQNGQTKRNY
uniref:EF-hand domain-containing protein n=1 Tax=Glossina austeni TaxID=7395 RepID=A0A1A9VKK1_GLOAU